MERRTFITAAATTPLLATGAGASTNPMLGLIHELENAPEYEMCVVHHTKAWVANELRKLHGLPEVDSENVREYRELKEHYRLSHARRRSLTA